MRRRVDETWVYGQGKLHTDPDFVDILAIFCLTMLSLSAVALFFVIVFSGTDNKITLSDLADKIDQNAKAIGRVEANTEIFGDPALHNICLP